MSNKAIIKKIACLKTTVGNYPCGTRIIVEAVVTAGKKSYLAWASFAKRPETFVGELPANLISFRG